MFSNLIRQQARLALSTRITFPLQRQSLLARPTTAQILSQRTFSISRSLFEESPISQSADAHVPNTEYSTNQNATARSEIKGPHPRRRALYLSNLPYSAEEAEIRELFEPYGRITSVTFGMFFFAVVMTSYSYSTLTVTRYRWTGPSKWLWFCLVRQRGRCSCRLGIRR